MQEQLMEEMERILDKLKELDPTSETYGVVLRSYRELEKALHEDLSACEEDLNGRLQRTLKEAEQKLDERRQELAEKEASNKLKVAKMEAIIGLAKTALTIIGTVVAILVTGSLEETTILSSKCLSWIKAIIPRT